MPNVRSWWDISSEEPLEQVGRFVENAFGVQEIVHIPRINWAYLDWLEDRGVDVKTIIRNCDRKRYHDEETFSLALEGWSHELFVYREELGEPRPDWLPPFYPE